MTINVKRLPIQRHLLILRLLADIVNWALFTLSTTCFIIANLGETVSSRTLIMFISSLPVMWCKSVRLVHNWNSDQSFLIGIETQHLLPTVIYWLTCRHAQAIDYVNVQTLDPFPQKFMSRIGWNSQKVWMMNTQSLSTLQVLQSFPH